MPAKSKLVSHPAKRLRDTMVRNLKEAIEAQYGPLREGAVTPTYKKIQAATGISLSSMQRIMSGETGPSVDTLADLAHHLGTTVPDLLAPRETMLPATPRPTRPTPTTGVRAQHLQRSGG